MNDMVTIALTLTKKEWLMVVLPFVSATLFVLGMGLWSAIQVLRGEE